MFYCVSCQIENQWPASVQTFQAKCDSCQEKKECFNVDVMSIVGTKSFNSEGKDDDHCEC